MECRRSSQIFDPLEGDELVSSLGHNSAPEGPAIRRIIFHEGIYDEDNYIAPRPNDVVIVGATKDEVGFDITVTAGGALHLISSATRLIPTLSSYPIIHMWAGLRPKGKQSYPLIGQVPSWENVTVASGHGGFGILLSAITGEAVSELITRGQLPERIYLWYEKG